MEGLIALLLIAGGIAAFLMFRWARLIVAVILIGTLVYFYNGYQRYTAAQHAQHAATP